jgi:hypothetical protein
MFNRYNKIINYERKQIILNINKDTKDINTNINFTDINSSNTANPFLAIDRIPCPFCNHTKEVIITTDSDGYYSSGCTYCHTYKTKKYKSAKEAIDAWNTRPIEQKLKNDLLFTSKSLVEVSAKLSNINFENADLEEQINKYKKILQKLSDFRSDYNYFNNFLSRIINDVDSLL